MTPVLRRIILAAVVATTIVLVIWMRNDVANSVRERIENERMQEVIQTIERIQDADIGVGDVDDDLRWLCERAGGGEACP